MSQQPPRGWGPYGPQYSPPRKKGPTVFVVILIIVGVMAVGGMGTCLVCVAVASKTASKTTPSPTPAVQDPHVALAAAERRALAACLSMMGAGVVTGCKPNDAVGRERLDRAIVTFKPVGMFSDDGGMISCFRDDEAYANATSADTDTPPDDYPDLIATSAKARLEISLTADATTTNAKSDDCIQKHMNLPVHDRLKACSKEINYEGKWTESMDKKKTVAACAKAYPAQYAKAHAWYDAAKHAVEQYEVDTF